MSLYVEYSVECDNAKDGKTFAECDWVCDAANTGDGFEALGVGWVTVDAGTEEGEGEYYCLSCAKKKGLVA